ncbi:hypothetical protein CDAR_610641 [Caerostris darwini]|uniref:Uncharacterized protein n=1 Tax=Caerostris darwini TaxID=1538125 RepID=A0AAV4MFJ6_9ARAC|nr:hypothetical protein CDAR_610641 [Caerostris darwini]
MLVDPKLLIFISWLLINCVLDVSCAGSRKKVYALAHLAEPINFNEPVNLLRNEKHDTKHKKKCLDGYAYDAKYKKCRQLICPDFYKLKKGKCVKN